MKTFSNYTFTTFLSRHREPCDVFWIIFCINNIANPSSGCQLFTLEKRLTGRKPCVFIGFGGCLLERVSVCEVPGLWSALNEC